MLNAKDPGVMISQAVDMEDPQRYRDSVYVNTLVVTGVFPAVYEYGAKNRAMRYYTRRSFTIRGMYVAHYAGLCCK